MSGSDREKFQLFFETFAENCKEDIIKMKMEKFIDMGRKTNLYRRNFKQAFEKSLQFLYFSYVDQPLLLTSLSRLFYGLYKQGFILLEFNLVENLEKIGDKEEK